MSFKPEDLAAIQALKEGGGLDVSGIDDSNKVLDLIQLIVVN